MADPVAPDLSALCEGVAAASRQVAAEGLAPGTAGNVSGRLGDRVAVTPTGARLSEMEAGDVTVVDRCSGEVIGTGLVPTSELALHLAIYARFPGAGGVVHTHAPAATALACVLEDVLPCIHYGMLALGGDVPVAPYRTFGTDELAEVTVTALEGRTAALLAGHGTITYGADVPAAVGSTRLLEWAARLYLDASVVGTPRVMTARERQDVVDLVAARGYGTLRAVER